MGTASVYSPWVSNTGYSAGVIGEVEFDRPFSKEVPKTFTQTTTQT